MFEGVGRWLIVMGVLLVFVGIVLLFVERFNLGSLPLDFHMKWGNTDVYIPLGTSIAISVLLTVLLNLIFWVMTWLTRG